MAVLKVSDIAEQKNPVEIYEKGLLDLEKTSKKVISGLISDAKKLKQEFPKSFESSKDIKKFNEAVKKTETNIKGLNKAATELTAVQKERIRIQKAQEREEAKSTQEVRKKEKALKAVKIANQQSNQETTRTIKLQRAESGSIQQLSAQLEINKNKYVALSAAERQNAAVGGVLLKTIQQQDAQLKQLNATIGRNQANVGAYGQAIKGAFAQFTGAALLAQGISRGIQEISQFVRGSIRLFQEQEQAFAQVAQGIESTGGAAGRSLKELSKQARDLQESGIFGDESILRGVTSQLLTFTNITGEAFDRTQQAALDVTTRLFGADASAESLKATSIQLGKALNDPVANLGALSRSGIQFSVVQKENIKDLANANRLNEAQAIILDELQNQYGGSYAAALDTATGRIKNFNNRIGDLQENLGRFIAGALSDLITKFDEFSQTAQASGIAKEFQIIGDAIGDAIAPIGDIIKQFGRLFNLFGDGNEEISIFSLLIKSIGLTIQTILIPIELLGKALVFLVDKLADVVEWAGEKLPEAWQWIIDNSGPLAVIIEKVGDALGYVVDKATDILKTLGLLSGDDGMAGLTKETKRLTKTTEENTEATDNNTDSKKRQLTAYEKLNKQISEHESLLNNQLLLGDKDATATILRLQNLRDRKEAVEKLKKSLEDLLIVIEEEPEIVIGDAGEVVNPLAGLFDVDGSDEVAKAVTEGLQEGINAGLDDLEAFKPTFRDKFWRALGVHPDDIAAVEQQAEQFINAFTTFLNKVTDAQIKAANDRIKARDANIQELEAQLKEEQDLQASGSANSVELYERQIEDEEALRDQAIKDREKAQKQQQQIDDAQQLSAIITAIANIVEGWSTVPFVGSILGIAAAGVMLASFLSLKSDANSLEVGGRGDDKGIITGKRHSQGGERFADNIEVEQGEKWWVMNRNASKKNGQLMDSVFDSLNNDVSLNLASSVVPEYPSVNVLNQLNTMDLLEQQKKTNTLLERWERMEIMGNATKYTKNNLSGEVIKQ